MGGSISVPRNEQLLEFVRALEVPEDALLSERALILVDSSFLRVTTGLGGGLSKNAGVGLAGADGLAAGGGGGGVGGDDGTGGVVGTGVGVTEVDTTQDTDMMDEDDAVAETKGEDEDEDEDELATYATAFGNNVPEGMSVSDSDLYVKAITRLSGRKQNVIPFLYGWLLFARRLVVMEHVRIVLFERKARPNGDPFFLSSFGLANTALTVNTNLLRNDGFDDDFDIDKKDMSMSILSNLCTSALDALRSLGPQVAEPVVAGLYEMMLGQYETLGICSLSNSSLDNTMEFLLTTFDECKSTDALQALCIIAIGRGSVYYLLQVALRLFKNVELTKTFEPIIVTFLEKCFAEAMKEQSGLQTQQQEPTTKDIRRKGMIIRFFEDEENMDEEDEQEIELSPTVVDICPAYSMVVGELEAHDSKRTTDGGPNSTIQDYCKLDKEGKSKIVHIDQAGQVWDAVPSLKSLLTSFGKKPTITMVACSKDHMLVLCSNGEVFAKGENKFGQCGQPTTSSSLKDLRKVELQDKPGISIAAGDKHSLFLVGEDDALLYSCGSNDYGQLGLGHKTPKSEPSRVSFQNSKQIRFISASGNHSVVVLIDNEILGFGLIKGRETLEPTLLHCCEPAFRVVGISSYGQYSFALEEKFMEQDSTFSNAAGGGGLTSTSSSRSLHRQASFGGANTLSYGAGKRKRKRKTLFRIVLSLSEVEQEQPNSKVQEPRVFHALSVKAFVATANGAIVLIDELRDSYVVPPSPRTGAFTELEKLSRYEGEEPAVAAMLWGLQKFPAAKPHSKFEVSRALLRLLNRVMDNSALVIPSLRVLQRHCFVASVIREEDYPTINETKAILFQMAKSPNQEIKEEAIRAIGNGFAFLSPTATELATFMSTITNMSYLTRFATLKFWSELFAQEQHDTAFILIERLIDLGAKDPDKEEVLNLLRAMQRSLLLCTHIESDIIQHYARSLAKASVQIIQASKKRDELEGTIVKSLTWPCIVMLQHQTVDISESVDDLLHLLAAVDSINTQRDVDMRTWIADMEWALVLLLIGKVCQSSYDPANMSAMVGSSATGSSVVMAMGGHGNHYPTGGTVSSPTSPAGFLSSRTTSSLNLLPAGLVIPTIQDLNPQINQSLFNSGFCEDDIYLQRMSHFALIVENAEHELMGKVSKMNRMKFRNKKGEKDVWRALRAVYAAIRIFDQQEVKEEDAPQTAMRLLRWLNTTNQALEDVDYEMLSAHVIERVQFALKLNNLSDHSLFTFVQQFDHKQLDQYERELSKQKRKMEQQVRGFELFTKLFSFVRSRDVRRHIIFSFTDYVENAGKNTQSKRVTHIIEQAISNIFSVKVKDDDDDEEEDQERSVDVEGGSEETKDEKALMKKLARMERQKMINSALSTAIIDACIATNQVRNPQLIKWIVDSMSFEAGMNAMPNHEKPGGVINIGNLTSNNLSSCRDAASLVYLPDPQGLPYSLGIQWSREHKHPSLKLSKNGLCFHLPLEVSNWTSSVPMSPSTSTSSSTSAAGSGIQQHLQNCCKTAAGIRLTHSLHSGRFYFQLMCSPGVDCPQSSLLYAIGLTPPQYDEWDSFTQLICCSLSAEQNVGLFVDMDAGLCMLYRHTDRFYVSPTECTLFDEFLIARHKIRTKQAPLCPSVSLLSPGTTALLKQVLVEGEAFKIVTDFTVSLKRFVNPSPRPTSGSVPTTPMNNASSNALGGSGGVGGVNNTAGGAGDGVSSVSNDPGGGGNDPRDSSNPEQNEEDLEEKSSLLLSGPLNLGLTEETELLVCGQNSYGELGLGDVKPHKEFTVASLVRDIFPVQVVAGNEVTGILNSCGEVYVWGYNKNGACGKPPPSSDGSKTREDHHLARVQIPTRINIPAFVTKLCCANGSEHMLAITSAGHLYGWGFNQYGQLGLGHKVERIIQPTRVEGALRDKRVILTASSYSHSLALTSDGVVYGFGLNTRGQLGIGSKADMWTQPQRLTHLAEIGRATSMACGVEHSAVCMEDGSLYTFGRNDCGQLGIDDMSKALSPFPVRVTDGLSKLRSLRCETVACGYYFTVVIADGTLHAFGKNDFGQLGVGHNHEVFAPVPVLWNGDDDRFVAVTCGTGHSLAATTYGRIIAWGRNKDGGLGNGTTVDHPFPVEVCNKGEMSLSLRDQRPIHLAAGFHHTCVLVGPRTNSKAQSNPSLNVVQHETPSWPLRTIKASVLAFTHFLHSGNPSEAAVEITIDWILQRIKEHAFSKTDEDDQVKQQHREQNTLCHKHNAAPISLCCLEERRVDALLGWIHGLNSTGFCSSSLYLNHLLFLLLDIISKPMWEFTHRFLQNKRFWVVDMLFEIAFTSGSPVRSSLVFDILGHILPGLSINKVSKQFSLKQLLLYIGRGDDLAVGAQITSLLRSLMTRQENGWNMCINRAIHHCIAQQVIRLPEDVEDLSVLDENSSRFLAMNGALQVLGASDEVLYNGAPVFLVTNDVDGQKGFLDWYRPFGGFQDVARVTLESSSSSVTPSSLIVSKHSELLPRSRTEVSVEHIAKPERILALLVTLVQQSVNLVTGTPGLQHVRAACLHEVAKSRASRVIATMLRDNPSMVQMFVSNGHLHAVTSLLAAPRGRFDDVSVQILQQRFLHLEVLRRMLDNISSTNLTSTLLVSSTARKVSNKFLDSSVSSSPVWVCSVCTYKNPISLKSCQMCFSRSASKITSSIREEFPEFTSDILDGTAKFNNDGENDLGKANKSTHDFEMASKTLSRSISSASMRAAELQTAQNDQLACTWSFEGGIIPDNKKTRVRLERVELEDENTATTTSNEDDGTLKSLVDSTTEEDKKYLKVPTESYLKFEHCFSGNGSAGSVYLNQYSVILDIFIPASSMDGEFVAILQTNTNNDSLADWYVKGDGSVGCIEYSKPGVVKPNEWNRLVMTTDLTKGEICYFVNGSKEVSLLHHGPGKHVLLLEDDRWALDSSFCLFRDVDQMRDAPTVKVARLQLRSYVMSSEEVKTLGGFDSVHGIPSPTIHELANRLSSDLKLPKAWCIRALQATQHRLPRARDWLRANEQALIARTVAEARMLTALGYPRRLCAHAICTTSSLSDAIHWLLDNDGITEHDLNIARIMQECSKDDTDVLMSNDMLAINLAEDDQDAHNRTYEIYDSTNAMSNESLNSGTGSSGGANSGSGNGGNSGNVEQSNTTMNLASSTHVMSNRATGRLSLPPLGCGIRQINAELWETARQLFISHARQATVSILENSLIVDSDNNNIVEDMQQKLLAVDGTGRSFLRNYLRAFPDSIRKDIRSGTVSQEVARGDPIQVLRRKLLLVFSREVDKDIKINPSSIPWRQALDTWRKQRQRKVNQSSLFLSESRKRLIPTKSGIVSSPKVNFKVGDTVWWIRSWKMDRPELSSDDAMMDGNGKEYYYDDDDLIEEGVVISIEERSWDDQTTSLSSKTLSGNNHASEEGTTNKKLEMYQKQHEEFQQLAKVIYDFSPQRKGDLAIKKGDTIVVLGATKSGWGRAKDLKTGAVGTIPLNCVDAIGQEPMSEDISNPPLPPLEHKDKKSNNNNEPAPEVEKRLEIVVENKSNKSKRCFGSPEELLTEKPPTSTSDKRIKQSLREQAEEDAWRSSVLRSLSEDVLHELVLLARGPWQFLPGGLQAGPSVQFQEVWCDKYTRTYEHTDPLTKKKKEATSERPPTIRIWRPFADSGFNILGDVATVVTGPSDTDRPPPVTVVSDDDGMGGKTTTPSGKPLLVPPVRYKLIWQDYEADNDEHVSFWQPIPPEGYIALGCVAVKGHSRREPDPKRDGLQQLRCVHNSCVQLSTLQHGLWSFRPGENKKAEEGAASGGQGGTTSTTTSASSSKKGGDVDADHFSDESDEDEHHNDDGAARLQKRRSNAGTKKGSTTRTSTTSHGALRRIRRSPITIWEIDNSSRTFVPIIAKQDQYSGKERNRERSKLLSMNRLDAATIESRLCMESQKKSTDEDTKNRMLHGLKLTTKYSSDEGSAPTSKPTSSQGVGGAAPVTTGNTSGATSGGAGPSSSMEDRSQDELRPYHLGLASTTNSNHGSSELLLWILQLFSEFDSNEKNGMGRLAKRVFSPELVHALLRFSRTATPMVRIKAIRMLAMVIRRTPADSLRGRLSHELLELRVTMEGLYKRQAQKPKDGIMDEMPLFSSLLCALAEVFVSVSLTQRQTNPTPEKVMKEKSSKVSAMEQPAESDGAMEEEDQEQVESTTTTPPPLVKPKHEYFDVTFDGALGIEILSNKDILIVHSVKPDGAAARNGICPGDIFWELNNKRITEYDRHEMWSTIKGVRPLTVTFLRDNDVAKSAAARMYIPSVDSPRSTSGGGSLQSDSTALTLSGSASSRPGTPISSAKDLMEEEVDPAMDPLTSRENWFQQLSELAAIMEALVQRGRTRMPSEFLMAEDTFLKLVLSNHTAIVESSHPFSNKVVKGQVTIPGAEALVVRFDRRCSTPFGKALQLSCNVKFKNLPKEIHVETLQGCFGGCSVHVPASTMLYQFPVPQQMNWCFHRTPDFKAPEIRVSNNAKTATLKKDKVWQTVFTTTGFNSGINMWEVRVDRTGPSANIFFGVAMKSAKVGNYLGSDDKGWGWIGCMACWHGGRKVRHRFGKRLKAGDIVRITLDIPRRAMSIACNGEDWGVAFNRLPLPSTILKPGNELVPTFSFYNKDDQITLLSGSTAIDLETAGILHQLRSNFEQQHAIARITPRFVNQGEGGSSSGGGGRGSRSGSSSRGNATTTTTTTSNSSSSSSSTSRSRTGGSLTRLSRRRTSSRDDTGGSRGTRRTGRRRRGFSESDNNTNNSSSSSTSSSTDGGDTATTNTTTNNNTNRTDGGEENGTQVEDQAVILSALGYPVEWCVQALNATDNDMNRAAEYLINHADRMAEESKQEAERAAVEAEEAVIAEEEEWLSQVNANLDLDQLEMEEANDHGEDDEPGGASATAAAAVAALQSAASSRIVQREYPVSGSTASGDDDTISSSRSGMGSSSAAKRSPKDRKRSGNKEWGYRMTISPLFSRDTTKMIALEPKNAQRLEMFHKMFETMTLRHDCDLVRLVNDICSKRGEDPLTLSPNDLEPTDEEFEKYPSLEAIPLLHLQLRFLLLRNFNRRLAHVLPLVDLSCPAHESALAAALRAVRGVVMSSVKKALFERVLADSHSGDDHWMQQNKIPTVTLDRNKAAQFLKSGRVDTKGTRTVFGQLFSQLHGRGVDEKSEKNPLLAPTPAVNDASLLRNSHRAWYTILAGERADDYGGPYRDVFNQACQELLTPALPLFVPCPNQVSNHGANRGKWIPSANASSQTCIQMYEFVGKLMGISMRTKNPFVLDLPSFVWKQLCNDQTTLTDIKEFDLDFYNFYTMVRDIQDDETLSRLDLKFTMKGSDGRVVELIPGGNSTAVTGSRKEDYLKALERARIHELDRQCTAIARGLGTQIPRNLLSIFTAEELELMVCGPPEVDVAILKMNTIYGDGINESTPSVQLFWQVMEEFSQDEKQKYLRFVWGRSRLPSSTADWERKHKINKYNKTPSDDYLPVGHTCFFSIDLPQYTSLAICRDKILFAINNCVSIDADDTTVARQSAEVREQRDESDDDEED